MPISKISAHTTHTSRYLRVSAIVLVLSFGLVHLLLHFKYTMDDAYITFRYASNLADGVGLVYNPGQYVKGFSNTLWTLLMTVPEVLGFTPLYFSKVLGLTSFGLVVVLLFHFTRESFEESVECPRVATRRNLGKKSTGSRRRGGGSHRSQGHPTPKSDSVIRSRSLLRWRLFPIFLLCLSAPATVWFMSGMEMGFYTGTVLAAVLLRLKEQRSGCKFPLSVLLFVAAIWTRPEGIIFFVAMAFHDIAYRIVTRRLTLGDVCWYLLPVGAYALELLWSQAYYGDPFPNTFYAKVRASEEASLLSVRLRLVARQLFLMKGDFGNYMHRWGGFGIVGLGLLGLLRWRRFRQNSAFFLMVAAQAAFVCRVGHDWMPACRFVVPVIPFMILLLTESLFLLSSFVRLPYRDYLSPVLVMAVAAVFVPGNYKMSRRVFKEARGTVSARWYLRRGNLFGSLTEPGRTLSTFDIGGIGYVSQLDIIDTAGLTNEFLARWRWLSRSRCVNYIMLLQPDIVRRHPGRQQPDQTLYHQALASRRYLAFSDGRILIRKDLVLVDRIPRDAVEAAVGDTGNAARVAAVRVPSVVLSGQRASGTLFWERPTDYEGKKLVSRNLALSAPSGFKKAVPSKCISEHVKSDVVWREGFYFADYFRFTAPTSPGTYTLTVGRSGADKPQPVATIEVTTPEAAPERSRRLLGQAHAFAGQEQMKRAIAASRVGAKIGGRDSKTLYLDLVVRYAGDKRTEADSYPPATAMARLNEAKFVLNRAFYDLGDATRALRKAIESVEVARTAIIDQVFNTASK